MAKGKSEGSRGRVAHRGFSVTSDGYSRSLPWSVKNSAGKFIMRCVDINEAIRAIDGIYEAMGGPPPTADGRHTPQEGD